MRDYKVKVKQPITLFWALSQILNWRLAHLALAKMREAKRTCKQPTGGLPRISQSPFQIVSRCAQSAKNQTNN